MNWHNIHVTDRNGGKYWNTTASPASTQSELRNIKRHLAHAKADPARYHFIDVDTAVIMLDGTPYGETTMTDDELLAGLLA